MSKLRILILFGLSKKKEEEERCRIDWNPDDDDGGIKFNLVHIEKKLQKKVNWKLLERKDQLFCSLALLSHLSSYPE